MSDAIPNAELPRVIGKPFEPGNTLGGRPKGSRNKLGEAFLADLHADWLGHGNQVIEAVRAEKPDVYLRVVASILPRELNVSVSELDDLTDEQLDRRIHALAQYLNIEISKPGNRETDGAPEIAPRADETQPVQALPKTG